MKHWWEIGDGVEPESAHLTRAVAYYRHSAQDRQENSIPIQQEQVREWRVVKTLSRAINTATTGLSSDGHRSASATGLVKLRRQCPRDRSHRNGNKSRSLTGLASQVYFSAHTNDRLGFSQPETPMKLVLQPWQLMLILLASWINREQQRRIEYLETQCDVLRDHIGKKRILLSDNQRRRLAVKGQILGRRALAEVGSLFTPDTILRWHRQLVANRWDYSDRKEKKPGRLRIRQVIVDLTIKFAKENPTWGYDRISGALANVGYHISDSTIGNILKANGFESAPDRKRTGSWETFLKAHWDVMASIDFTTVEVWTKGGLTTFYLLFVMELKTRRVHFAGSTTNPNEAWMKTVALELTNHEDGFLNDKKYLIMDRDATFSQSFRDFLSNEGVKPVRLPPRSPNLNAHLERFFGSLKSECLHKLILFGETATRKTVRSFLEHYHTERNHQGLGNELIIPMDRSPDLDAEIETTERLGGLLRSYRRAA